MLIAVKYISFGHDHILCSLMANNGLTSGSPFSHFQLTFVKLDGVNYPS